MRRCASVARWALQGDCEMVMRQLAVPESASSANSPGVPAAPSAIVTARAPTSIPRETKRETEWKHPVSLVLPLR